MSTGNARHPADQSLRSDVERPAGRSLRVVIWTAGIAVALGAAAATAHGLYEVARAARVPAGIAWLYPLITDGLALVAYAATARLRGSEARYAWTVVVIAAGLSGLAQAAYLAGDGGPAQVAPALRFGIGAWPAVAAAVVAHLLYLLATADPSGPAQGRAVQPVHPAFTVQSVQAGRLDTLTVQSASGPEPVQSELGDGGSDAAQRELDEPQRRPGDGPSTDAPLDSPTRALPSPARDRAEAAATRHARRHGTWPTVSELEAAAEVSRGTAAAALKTLRDRPAPLHLINTGDRDAADSDDHDQSEDIQP